MYHFLICVLLLNAHIHRSPDTLPRLRTECIGWLKYLLGQEFNIAKCNLCEFRSIQCLVKISSVYKLSHELALLKGSKPKGLGLKAYGCNVRSLSHAATMPLFARLSGCRGARSQAASPDSPLSLRLTRDRHSCQIKINRILKDVRAKYFILALGTN